MKSQILGVIGLNVGTNLTGEVTSFLYIESQIINRLSIGED